MAGQASPTAVTDRARPVGHAPSWREVDWAAQTRSERIDGATMSYVELGSGEPTVLLVHGLGAQWRVWAPVMPILAQRYRVLAVDLPGFGDSQPGAPPTIENLAGSLATLCARLRCGPVVVVGNSMGGFVAAELALAALDLVGGLVLVDAAGMVATRAELARVVPFLYATALLGGRVSAAAATLSARPGLRRLALGQVVCHPERLPADLARWALLAPPGPSTRAALSASVSALTEAWAGRLTELRCPTLIVWGEQDGLIPVRHAHEYQRRIVGSQLVTLPDAGHVPMLECPEPFGAALADFLAGIGAAPGG